MSKYPKVGFSCPLCQKDISDYMNSYVDGIRDELDRSREEAASLRGALNAIILTGAYGKDWGFEEGFNECKRIAEAALGADGKSV